MEAGFRTADLAGILSFYNSNSVSDPQATNKCAKHNTHMCKKKTTCKQSMKWNKNNQKNTVIFVAASLEAFFRILRWKELLPQQRVRWFISKKKNAARTLLSLTALFKCWWRTELFRNVQKKKIILRVWRSTQARPAKLQSVQWRCVDLPYLRGAFDWQPASTHNPLITCD